MRPQICRFCKLNNDDRYDNCDRPQEIDNDEIDILLKAQNDAEEQGLAMVPGLKEKTGWNSRKTNKIDVADAKSAGAAAGPNDNVWHRIHRNIFTHREPKSVTEDDVLICNCVPGAESGGLGCGDECINRDVYVLGLSQILTLCLTPHIECTNAAQTHCSA